MDAISTYKQEALPRLKDTISQFKELAKSGEEQVRRIEEAKKLT
jgi:uncharacterized protein YaaN involved in tellurite resistance